MKRKFIIGLVSAFVLGCMSIPVFAGAAPENIAKPEFKGWLSHYEQLYCWTDQYDLYLNYTIRTKDKNGKKLDEKSGSAVPTYSKKKKDSIYKTASSTKAKSGYYYYKIYVSGFGNTKWSDSGNQS